MSVTPKDQYAIRPGARILVTGANGYIGSHVVDVLLSLGYIVRGTVRAEKPWLNELFDSKYGPGRYETVVVPELDDKEALVRVLSDVSGIAHVASDVSFDPDAKKVVSGVISATEAVLKAAAETSVKSVVLTSSTAAVLFPQPGVEDIVVTEDTWNDAAVKAAWDENTTADAKPFVVYAASKTEGERAAWRWVKENKPDFVFNSVIPNLAVGTILHPEIAGSTMKWTADLLRGSDRVIKMLPPQWHINVADIARIHAIALLDPNVKSERLFACAAPFTWTGVIDILRKLRPSNKSLVDPPKNEKPDLSDIVPSKRAESLLKSFFGQSGWIDLEQSLKDGIDSVNY